MKKSNDNAGRHTVQSSKRKNVQLGRRLKITQLGETLFESCTQPLCIPELGKHVFLYNPFCWGYFWPFGNSAAITAH